MRIAYERYEDVPWYRRSWANNLFVLLGLFGFLPTAIWACANLLSGKVYMNTYDREGRIRTWGILNKILALLFALVWTCIFANAGYQVVTGQPTHLFADTGKKDVWETFVSKEGRFSVLFPGKPKETEHQPKNSSIIKDVRFETRHDEVDYSIGYIDHSKEMVDQIRAMNPAEFIKRHREITVRNTKGEVLTQNEVTLGNSEYIGYELVIRVGPRIFVRQRVFYANGRLYQAMTATGTHEKVMSTEANRFHNSLRLSE